MTGIIHQDPEQLSLSASISNHVVRMLHAYTGRGPTKAWTSFDADLITVVLRDTLTKGERSLVANGRRELVLQTRKAFQDAMAVELIAGVQERTGRTVIAFLSENHIDPDIAIENFVLAPNGGASAPDDDS
jgi:uncharacterized protein YbcI